MTASCSSTAAEAFALDVGEAGGGGAPTGAPSSIGSFSIEVGAPPSASGASATNSSEATSAIVFVLPRVPKKKGFGVKKKGGGERTRTEQVAVNVSDRNGNIASSKYDAAQQEK